MEIDKLISQIYNKIEILKKNFSDSDIEFTYCFRGEAKDYGKTKLTPTLFRENTSGSDCLDKELINLITDYRIVEDESLNSLTKAIEGQHFLALSRLLDVTFSILPSLFFASSTEKDANGYIYVFQFPKTYSPSSTYINTYYEKIISEEILPYYQNFKVLSHTQSNNRIKSQSGGFILFPGLQLSIKGIPNVYYEKVEIKAENKEKILEELDKFFNINEATIYPEKDKKRELIRNKLFLTSKDTKELNSAKEFCITEVTDALERITYECSIALKDANENSKKNIRRILRREKRDLFNYINKNFDKGYIEESVRDGQIKKVETEIKKWNSII